MKLQRGARRAGPWIQQIARGTGCCHRRRRHRPLATVAVLGCSCSATAGFAAPSRRVPMELRQACAAGCQRVPCARRPSPPACRLACIGGAEALFGCSNMAGYIGVCTNIHGTRLGKRTNNANTLACSLARSLASLNTPATRGIARGAATAPRTWGGGIHSSRRRRVGGVGQAVAHELQRVPAVHAGQLGALHLPACGGVCAASGRFSWQGESEGCRRRRAALMCTSGSSRSSWRPPASQPGAAAAAASAGGRTRPEGAARRLHLAPVDHGAALRGSRGWGRRVSAARQPRGQPRHICG